LRVALLANTAIVSMTGTIAAVCIALDIRLPKHLPQTMPAPRAEGGSVAAWHVACGDTRRASCVGPARRALR